MSAAALSGGCAATSILIRSSHVAIAYLGDVRAVLLTHDGTIQRLTRDHRATNKIEAALVESKGGKIEMVRGQPRVDGLLAITRAIGDDNVPSLIREPEIVEFDIGKDFLKTTKYLIVASDGLWDAVEYHLRISISCFCSSFFFNNDVIALAVMPPSLDTSSAPISAMPGVSPPS